MRSSGERRICVMTWLETSKANVRLGYGTYGRGRIDKDPGMRVETMDETTGCTPVASRSYTNDVKVPELSGKRCYGQLNEQKSL